MSKSKNYLTKTVALEDVVVDSVFQCREAIDQKVVDEYAGLVSEGVEFPPIEVVKVGEKLYLTDGFSRRAAFVKAGKKKIKANIFDGDWAFAIERACCANETHGIKRNINDKRKAVRLALRTFPDRSLRDIAKICNVSHTFASALQKKDSEQAAESSETPEVATLPPASDHVSDVSVETDQTEWVDAEPVEAKPEPVSDVVSNPSPEKKGKVKAKAAPKPEVSKRDDLVCKICNHGVHVETDAGWLCEECGNSYVPGDESAIDTDEAPSRSPEIAAVHAAFGVLIRKASNINVLSALKPEFDVLCKRINALG